MHKTPDEIGESRAQVMLKRGCYQGLRDGLKESLRYLYDNPNRTYEDLVEKVIQIDGEKNGRHYVLSTSGITDNEPKMSDTAGSQETPGPVQELIKVLMAALQTKIGRKSHKEKENFQLNKLGLGVLN